MHQQLMQLLRKLFPGDGFIIVRIRQRGHVPYLHCPLCGEPRRVDLEGMGTMALTCARCRRQMRHQHPIPAHEITMMTFEVQGEKEDAKSPRR